MNVGSLCKRAIVSIDAAATRRIDVAREETPRGAAPLPSSRRLFLPLADSPVRA